PLVAVVAEAVLPVGPDVAGVEVAAWSDAAAPEELAAVSPRVATRTTPTMTASARRPSSNHRRRGATPFALRPESGAAAAAAGRGEAPRPTATRPRSCAWSRGRRRR